MVKKTNDSLITDLNSINWNFEDYNSAKYPLDINSIPWYPATFPAPIPKFLVALLSNPEDVVMDPFGGKGTTVVEALRQRRKFIYNDLNPHAVAIMNCLLDTLSSHLQNHDLESIAKSDKDIFSLPQAGDYDTATYEGKKRENIFHDIDTELGEKIQLRKIKEDVFYWYHKSTLRELLSIYDHILQFEGAERSIRKLAFISILKEVSSQRGHFSYVTDNCRPSEMKYYNAYSAYLDMLDRIVLASMDYRRQYTVINKNSDLSEIANGSHVLSDDARKLTHVKSNSADLVITSPPYLCAQDYVLTMRLNDFFFPEQGFVDLPFKEIGPRRLRRRPSIVTDYFEDMKEATSEIHRVLKDGSFYALIIGQGKGKVSEGVDIIKKVVSSTIDGGFRKLFQTTRSINYRSNRIGGVDKEDIILFQK